MKVRFGDLQQGAVFSFGYGHLFMRLAFPCLPKDTETLFDWEKGLSRNAIWMSDGFPCHFADSTEVEPVELEWVDHGPFNRVR